MCIDYVTTSVSVGWPINFDKYRGSGLSIEDNSNIGSTILLLGSGLRIMKSFKSCINNLLFYLRLIIKQSFES